MKRFYSEVDKKTGQHYICNPEGKRILHYWWCSFGRLGNTREYNMYTIEGKDEYAKEILVLHGGFTREILLFLNTGIMCEYVRAHVRDFELLARLKCGV